MSDNPDNTPRGDIAAQSDHEPEGTVLSPEAKKRRDRRSVAIALALGAAVIMFFIVTIVRLGSNVAQHHP